jgi:hypothetical protein
MAEEQISHFVLPEALVHSDDAAGSPVWRGAPLGQRLCERAVGRRLVRAVLTDHYGVAVAEQICSAKALRVLNYGKGN